MKWSHFSDGETFGNEILCFTYGNNIGILEMKWSHFSDGDTVGNEILYFTYDDNIGNEMVTFQ